jgi:N12 class adenine-specific DNA methylase
MESNKITPIGKLFFTSLLASLTNGAKFNWKLKGTPEQTDDFMKVVKAVKDAIDETKKGDQTTVQNLMDKINAKQEALANFEQKYGFKLPI